ncbi:MAG: MG2 domain-containing protein, partial [Flavobacteriales bacterium]|nr:MG2 domain-containing protein [Flavobacteriales bacterium]
MRLIPMFLALLFTSSCLAQNFGGLWQEVGDFTRNGQPKSALKVIEKIHAQALKQNNGPQLIKAVIHEIKFNSQFEEESLVASITRLEDEAQRLQSPTKEIIHSLLAEMYWGYYQNNSWQIHKRTATTKEDGNILTWDFKRIAQEADRYFQLSLSNPTTLHSAKLESYEAILTGSKTYREMRPSLFHLLLSRALDFYSSETRELINFDRSGVYNDAHLLGDQDTFLSWKPVAGNGLSPAVTTIGLFQELLRESEQLIEEARVSEDLRRLKFMHRRSQLAEKDSLYEAALRQLLSSHPNQPLYAEITHHLADLFYHLGSNASLKDSAVQWNWKTAYELCESVIGAYPNSFGSRNCKSLMEQIAMKNFRLQAEKVVLPNKPFRVLVNYRNLGNVKSSEWTVYAQIAKIDPLKYRAEAKRNYGEKRIKWLKKNSTPVAETSFNLPNPGDFHEHSIELPLDELPIGTYVVFVGTDKSHSTNNQAVAYALITVSDITLLKRNDPDGKMRMKVVSRDTGKPLANARIDLLSLVYNRKARSNHYELNVQLQTDENGEAFWNADGQNYRGLMVDVYHGDDRLINADNIYGRNNREVVQWDEQTHFFLDRAIYRPGQTIHFKGIMLTSNGNEVKTVSDQNSTVQLFDANGQEVSSLELKTNGFGTFSGTFIAPTGGLNGMIRIGNTSGSHSFRMEEYKRPKFEVTVNRPTDQFRVNDTVSVTGTALSYSGIPLDGAEVKYRVTRTARYPFPWLCWGWYPQSEPKHVAFGTTVSNEVGEFRIDFQAQPDPLVQPKYRPVFSYNVEVDVADKSGEMQTGNTSVSVGYHALNLSIELPSVIDRDDLKDYDVSATNLSGEKQDAKVTVKVWTLKQNNRILRRRVWQQPDQFLLSESEYKRKFHNDPYKDEGNFQTWEKDRNMLDTKFSTETVSSVSLEPLNTLPQGYYLVELISKDAFGTEVIQRAYFNMIGRYERVPPISTTAWFHALKDTYQPGEKVELLVGSSYAFVDFLVEVEVKDKGARSNRIVHSETVSVTGTQERMVIPVTEAWRGNAQIQVSAVRNNEQLSWSKTISVPYTNKQLEVKLETFRKAMTPDDAEEWTLKITDKEGKPVKAELLSTMYDASLDILAANNWGLQPYRFLNARFQWQTNSFGRA